MTQTMSACIKDKTQLTNDHFQFFGKIICVRVHTFRKSGICEMSGKIAYSFVLSITGSFVPEIKCKWCKLIDSLLIFVGRSQRNREKE